MKKYIFKNWKILRKFKKKSDKNQSYSFLGVRPVLLQSGITYYNQQVYQYFPPSFAIDVPNGNNGASNEFSPSVHISLFDIKVNESSTYTFYIRKDACPTQFLYQWKYSPSFSNNGWYNYQFFPTEAGRYYVQVGYVNYANYGETDNFNIQLTYGNRSRSVFWGNWILDVNKFSLEEDQPVASEISLSWAYYYFDTDTNFVLTLGGNNVTYYIVMLPIMYLTKKNLAKWNFTLNQYLRSKIHCYQSKHHYFSRVWYFEMHPTEFFRICNSTDERWYIAAVGFQNTSKSWVQVSYATGSINPLPPLIH